MRLLSLSGSNYSLEETDANEIRCKYLQSMGTERNGKESFHMFRYLQFVKDLQEASRDNLAFIKEKAVKAIYDLLRSNPEQEALLLTALVDKLGDPSRKIASNVCFSFILAIYMVTAADQSKLEAIFS